MFTICLHFVHTLFTVDPYNVLKDKGKGYSKRVLKVYSIKQYIKLNSETFEVKKLKYEPEYLDYKTLYDCYVNPSKIKRVIYNKLGELIGQLYITKTRQEFWTV